MSAWTRAFTLLASKVSLPEAELPLLRVSPETGDCLALPSAVSVRCSSSL